MKCAGEGDQMASSPEQSRGRVGQRLAAHGAALMLALPAAAMTLWAMANWAALSDQPRAAGARPNPLALFRWLGADWLALGGGLDLRALAFAVGAVALLTVIGAFLLEGFEVYLARPARLALAYLLGMGAAGVVLEWLAIPHLLGRVTIALALGALLAVLMALAWRRAHRPSDSGLGGGDAEGSELRHTLARQAWAATLTPPRALHEFLYAGAALLGIAAISGAIFWHGLLYPEVYWDSLILYLGYARMTFIEGGFPVKVVGQVGIGLGANYPHLFAVLGAGVATAMGDWSELPQRLMAPLAGLASTVLVYQTALRLTRHINLALTAALLYRSIPQAIAFDTYASDYALAVLFTIGLLYLAVCYIQTALPGYLMLGMLLVAFSLHLNYLMPLLGLPLLLTVLGAHLGRGRLQGAAPEAAEAPWTALPDRPGLGRLLGSGWLWGWLLVAGLIGSTWYVRNWLVTGNPVYAFFPDLLGGIRINPEVMAAAEEEWQANGAGIGRFGPDALTRLMNAWVFFAGSYRGEDGSLQFWGPAYRLSPIFLGFALPGMIVWLGSVLAGPWAGRRTRLPGTRRFGLVVVALALALLVFHFVMAPFYLYQINPILPCLALAPALAWPWWRLRPWRWLLGGLVLTVGLVPGLGWALMGFKITGEMRLEGERVEYPQRLYTLRRPLPDPNLFYGWRYGEDPVMWEYLNTHLLGRRLLTHENRHLVIDPSIELVHLDDWDIQPLWEVEPAERVRRLTRDHNIHFYLFVPNELAARSNARMGTAQWPELGLAELIFEAGENRLYRLIPPPVE